MRIPGQSERYSTPHTTTEDNPMLMFEMTNGTPAFTVALNMQTAAVLMLWFYGISLFAGFVHASLHPRRRADASTYATRAAALAAKPGS
jgi:hypothetical protein